MSNSKRVVVTGGAGFIGSHIVDRLAAQGSSVLVIDDLSSGNLDFVPDGVEFVKADFASEWGIRAVLDFEPDAIVHAAAQISVRESMQNPAKDVETNVLGLVRLLSELRKLETPESPGLPYVLFISTGGALYGEQDEFPATESHKIDPLSVYGLSKYVGECYLRLWKLQFRLPYGVVRLSNVYGPRQNAHGEAGVIAIFCERLIAGEQPVINGSGEQTRDFVYVGDVADAVGAMCAHRTEGIFNIGTGVETSINRVFDVVNTATGSRVERMHGDAKPGEQMRSAIDSGKAGAAFGWKPRLDIEAGLQRTVEWYAKK